MPSWQAKPPAEQHECIIDVIQTPSRIQEREPQENVPLLRIGEPRLGDHREIQPFGILYGIWIVEAQL